MEQIDIFGIDVSCTRQEGWQAKPQTFIEPRPVIMTFLTQLFGKSLSLFDEGYPSEDFMDIPYLSDQILNADYS